MLVYPAEAENAFEVGRALQQVVGVRVYGASSRAGYARHVFNCNIEDAPNVQEDDFSQWLESTARQLDLHAVIPTHDLVAAKLTASVMPNGLRMVCSESRTAEICLSKRRTAQALAGSPWLPRIDQGVALRYPVFVKPDVGAGGKGSIKLDDQKSFDAFFAQRPFDQYLVSEFLPGKEYTIDCFSDRHGKLRFVGARTRDQISNGIATLATSISEDQFQPIAEDIAGRIRLRGYWYFQVREDSQNKLRIMEVSCRAAAGIGLYRQRGVNLPLLALYDALNIDVEICAQNFDVAVARGMHPRYRLNLHYDSIFIDFDDTLVVRGQTNIYALQLLIQSNKRKCPVFLLTRHDGNIEKALRAAFVMPELFERIFVIDNTQRKEDLVTIGSIFIDNSFAERRSVWRRWGIPVFDVDAIPALIDSTQGEFA